jgi:hypothetical protein
MALSQHGSFIRCNEHETFIGWNEHPPFVQWNWFAFLSYAASFAFSIAFWTGIISGVAYLMR